MSKPKPPSYSDGFDNGWKAAAAEYEPKLTRLQKQVCELERDSPEVRFASRIQALLARIAELESDHRRQHPEDEGEER
jgi:hypothetical protein